MTTSQPPKKPMTAAKRAGRIAELEFQIKDFTLESAQIMGDGGSPLLTIADLEFRLAALTEAVRNARRAQSKLDALNAEAVQS